jgi:LPS export ABC transporter protein LptC
MDDQDDVMEFPLGFEVIMFDGQHQPTTQLIAGYGKSFGNNRIEAEDSVVVRRFGDNAQVMYSDKLFWYQDLKMIYTRSHVRIVTPDKEVEGDSLVATEDFSEYTMYSGSAMLDIDEEE